MRCLFVRFLKEHHTILFQLIWNKIYFYITHLNILFEFFAMLGMCPKRFNKIQNKIRAEFLVYSFIFLWILNFKLAV